MKNRTSFDGRWELLGLRAGVLSNRWIRLVVLPELGGKLWSLEYRPLAHEWLWHNPRIQVSRLFLGAPFDENWAGGADLAFPSCHTSHWNDWPVPELGELWSIPWDLRFDEDDEAGTLTLSAGGRIWPITVTRTIRLPHDRPIVELGFEIANIGPEPCPFIMGLHPALAIAPGYRIDLPPGKVRVDEAKGDMGVADQEYLWPMLPTLNGQRDMRRIPPQSQGEYGGHFFWPTGPDLWWSVTDQKSKTGIGLVASHEQFEGFWMWQVYGGWRGYYHLALEPWTSYPITLHEGVEAGTAQWLVAGQPYSAQTRLVCFEGYDAVSRIDPDGTVVGHNSRLTKG